MLQLVETSSMRAPRQVNYVSIWRQINLHYFLILLGCENRGKHVEVLWGQIVGSFNVKTGDTQSSYGTSSVTAYLTYKF